ncbi:MAG: helix-turn-helix transcriptional regulator [Lachnospiraceae bacterium]|nr:helix-turn-helix transcriptional regulator [Lachnospiraceae bacterium]
MEKDYGHLEIKLAELIAEKGLNKYKLSNYADMSWQQVDSYCKNEVTRLDAHAISKLCFVLGCEIQDLLVYRPPES